MTLKKIETIGIFVIFVLSFLTHFLYNIFPSFLFSLVFPVNESVWEHMKMIVSAILIWKVLEYFILKKNMVYHNNFLFSAFIMALLSIIIFLIIYYPIYMLIGESFILNIICLFVTIYFVSIISYNIMNSKYIKYGSFIGILGIILIYTIFGLLTYFPLKNKLFLDSKDNKYGINIYVV